ncbi:hypothetical protein C0995_015938 [Termitomyces sp. Mi166|nr:hypothetical protein C0995_015938 [Termitomyces sp. Mi166\
MSPSNNVLTGKGIRKAARAAVAAFPLVVPPAQYMDVDIIVITEMDPEDIKELILAWDDRFYLVPSANPRNTYSVLWFTVSSRKTCKVDILIPVYVVAERAADAIKESYSKEPLPS